MRRSRWPRLRVSLILAVFVGGSVGGLARYAVTKAWPTAAYDFPWATFTVNTIGAFVLAVLFVLVVETLPPTTYVRALVGTGFCGSLTTFGAVVADADQRLAHGHPATGMVYLASTVAAGLGAAVGGFVLARHAVTTRHRDRGEG